MDIVSKSIKDLSEILYNLTNVISTTEKNIDCLDKQKQDNIKKLKVKALALASQIDISICIFYLNEPSCKYEAHFFLNIALMKMKEIIKKLVNVHTETTHELYYNPSEELKDEIMKLLNSWNDKYNKWINDIRIFSTAHYDIDIVKFINYGYKDIDPSKNQKCFDEFIHILKTVQKNINVPSSNL